MHTDRVFIAIVELYTSQLRFTPTLNLSVTPCLYR